MVSTLIQVIPSNLFIKQQYLSKLSQPLLDRIDLQIEVESVSVDELTIRKFVEEDSKMIRNRVQKARNIQF